MSRTSTSAAEDARESRRLSTLLEVSQALSGTLNLRSALHRVLEVLGKHHGYVRSLVTLLQDNGELHVAASDGLDTPAHAVKYRLGEGIVGKVVESGRPIVVPRVSKEPTFLNRASKRSDAAKDELSFICVPILLNRPMIVVAIYLEPHGSTVEHSSQVPILFLVTAGRGFVRIGGPEGKTRPLTAGDAVLWPAHLDHTVWTEDEPLEAILIDVPAEREVASVCGRMRHRQTSFSNLQNH